jgi:hypothetical protein
MLYVYLPLLDFSECLKRPSFEIFNCRHFVDKWRNLPTIGKVVMTHLTVFIA